MAQPHLWALRCSLGPSLATLSTTLLSQTGRGLTTSESNHFSELSSRGTAISATQPYPSSLPPGAHSHSPSSGHQPNGCDANGSWVPSLPPRALGLLPLPPPRSSISAGTRVAAAVPTPVSRQHEATQAPSPVLPGPKPLPSFSHSIPLSFWLDTSLATAVPTPTHAQEAPIQHALTRTWTCAHTHIHTHGPRSARQRWQTHSNA